jgi:hypothetical protein
MSNTYVIGEWFLLRKNISDNYFSAIIFNGSIKLDNGFWRANFSREKLGVSDGGTSFNLDISMNDVVRFATYGIWRDKKGNTVKYPPLIASKIQLIDSIKFLDIGQDFITIEYNVNQN